LGYSDLAEEVGIEPTRPFGQAVFGTAAAATRRLALPRLSRGSVEPGTTALTTALTVSMSGS